MTIEQFKQLKKNQKNLRSESFHLHKKMKEEMLQRYELEGNERMLDFVNKTKTITNSRLSLPRTPFSKKIRGAFEEMILNDIAATEGRCCNTCSIDYVNDLEAEMEKVSGIKPKTYCFIHSQDIPDIRKGSFYLGWGGDVQQIKSILERHGLKVTYKNENTKLLVEEK